MDGNLILALDTATTCGSVALLRGSRLLAETTAQPEMSHTRRLLGTVSRLMHSMGIDWKELDAIAVSLGPGSFTGLRVGLAAAKGLVMATGACLVGVSSLESLALSCGICSRWICPVLDARKGEVYTAFFRTGNHPFRPERLSPDRAVAPEQLVKSIVQPVVVAGPGVEVYGELFSSNPLVHCLPYPLGHPRALYVGLVGWDMMQGGETLDPATAAPAYIRASEAEINAAREENAGRGQHLTGT